MLFNEKLDLRLIKLVKDNPVLYDHNNVKYMDFNAREVAWQKIGDELKRPAADCKVRWINIRDVNRRILKKIMTDPDQRTRVYKYKSEMAFMRPFYKDMIIQNGDYESDSKSIDQADESYFDDAYSDDSDKPITKLKVKKSRKSIVKKKKNRSSDGEDDPVTVTFSEGMPQTEFDPSDPVDAFLLSIGATLKTFTPYNLNLAKSKIFAVVQEHDLQQIVQKQRQDSSTNELITEPVNTDKIYYS